MNWKLPDGWSWTSVSEHLTRVRSQVRPDAIQENWTYVGLEHVSSASGEYEGIEGSGAGIRSNKFLFEPGDILYGKLRPNLRKCVVANEVGICSTDLIPLRPINPESAHFISMQMRSQPFTTCVIRLIGGASLPRIGVKDLLDMPLPTPPPEKAAELYALARSVSSLRTRQREAEATIDGIEASVTGLSMGLVSDGGIQEPSTVALDSVV